MKTLMLFLILGFWGSLAQAKITDSVKLKELDCKRARLSQDKKMMDDCNRNKLQGTVNVPNPNTGNDVSRVTAVQTASLVSGEAPGIKSNSALVNDGITAKTKAIPADAGDTGSGSED